MLKDLLNQILALQNPERLELDGRLYTTKQVVPVTSPRADTLIVYSLTGLLDYLTSNVDKLIHEDLLIHVENPREVSVVSNLHGDFRERECLIKAQIDALKMPFNTWVDHEEFNIFMQSCFVDDPATHRAAILKIIGNVQDGVIRNVNDDGVSQEVTIKTGIARVGNVTIPNPVLLRPYRTFTEVEQPASQFVFRMKEGPRCMLVEADGGAWRNTARQNIKQYLAEQLNAVKIPANILA